MSAFLYLLFYAYPAIITGYEKTFPAVGEYTVATWSALTNGAKSAKDCPPEQPVLTSCGFWQATQSDLWDGTYEENGVCTAENGNGGAGVKPSALCTDDTISCSYNTGNPSGTYSTVGCSSDEIMIGCTAKSTHRRLQGAYVGSPDSNVNINTNTQCTATRNIADEGTVTSHGICCKYTGNDGYELQCNTRWGGASQNDWSYAYCDAGDTIMACGGYSPFDNSLSVYHFHNMGPLCEAHSVGQEVYAQATCCRLYKAPTSAPTDPTNDPTIEPTFIPTVYPTNYPTFMPTNIPTNQPTFIPTVYPSNYPTFVPTVIPTFIPTIYPTTDPTLDPTIDPTLKPTFIPTFQPTLNPTKPPTRDGGVRETTTFVTKNGKNALVKSEDSFGLWLMVGILVILTLCACALFIVFVRRRNKGKAHIEHIVHIGTGMELAKVSSMSQLGTNSPISTEKTSHLMTTNIDGAETPNIEVDPYSDSFALKMWLQSIDMMEYYALFIQEGFGEKMAALKSLNDADLKGLGIDKLAHRKLILTQIASNQQQIAVLNEGNYVETETNADLMNEDDIYGTPLTPTTLGAVTQNNDNSDTDDGQGLYQKGKTKQ